MDITNKFAFNYAVKSSALNEHFQCGICEGYMIDATTLSECYHSFGKSCIVHFIQTIDHRCPTCNTNLNDSKNCIKSDSSLQRLIYCMVPNLLVNELERRNTFMLTSKKNNDYLNKDSLVNLKLFSTQSDEYISLLEKINSKENISAESARKATKMISALNSNLNSKKEVRIKYIQCVAQTPIRILIKLIRNKYNISLNYKIKLSHHGHVLGENESLLEVFTSFIQNKDDVFDIKYELILNRIKKFLPSIKSTSINSILTPSTSNLNDNNNNDKEVFQPKPIQSNKLINQDFLRVKLKKPNNISILNNSKAIKKYSDKSILNNSTEFIKKSIGNKNITTMAKFKSIKKKETYADESKSNPDKKEENQVKESFSSSSLSSASSTDEPTKRRLSNESEKSFKTSEEDFDDKQNAENNLNKEIEAEIKVDQNIQNNQDERMDIVVASDDVNDIEKENKEIRISEISETSNSSISSSDTSDEAKLIIDDNNNSENIETNKNNENSN